MTLLRWPPVRLLPLFLAFVLAGCGEVRAGCRACPDAGAQDAGDGWAR